MRAARRNGLDSAAQEIEFGHARDAQVSSDGWGYLLIEALFAGLAAGYAIAIPVGAVAAYLVTLGARAGWRVGAGGALGAAAVDGAYATLAVAAGSILAPYVLSAQEPLRWVSVVVLFALGFFLVLPAFRREQLEPGVEQPRVQPSAVGAFFTVAGITLVNPVTLIYFAALASSLKMDASASVVGPVTFVVAAFAASASWQLFLTTAGSSIGRVLTGPRGKRLTALLGGAMVMLLAGKAALGV